VSEAIAKSEVSRKLPPRSALVPKHRTQLEKIPDAIILDPTLQRDDTACPKCGSHGVVFIQPKEAPGDTRMKIVNICLNTECVFKWE
jgi:DNA-directed RNA polymerase subunit M/transcription elongation factor TFIIS